MVEHAASSPPTSRGRASRARLLEAAADCFGRLGYSATRVADITSAAGMSQGGFYRHFKDKNEILVEALREPLDELLETTAAQGPPEEEQIVAANVAFFTVYARHRRVFRVIREAAALHEPGLVEIWLDLRSQYVRRVEAWLREIDARAPIATSSIELLAEALGAVLDQMAYTRLGLPERTPTKREVEALGRVSGELWFRAIRTA